MDFKVGFVGFGHMAQLLLQGIEGARFLPRSHLAFTRRDPSLRAALQKRFGVEGLPLRALIERSEVLVICVRPGQLADLMEEVGPLQGKKILSVLAGTPIARFEERWGEEVIRAMPNIASAVGEGMTVLSFGKETGSDFQTFARLFFGCVGKVLVVEEKLMDISCAIAGSGPGFVFRLIQAVAEAGEKGGLKEGEALQMAAQAFLGASRLILEGNSPDTLLDQIATPKGTTEAGLKEMERLHLPTHLQQVIEASKARSEALSRRE